MYKEIYSTYAIPRYFIEEMVLNNKKGGRYGLH